MKKENVYYANPVLKLIEGNCEAEEPENSNNDKDDSNKGENNKEKSETENDKNLTDQESDKKKNLTNQESDENKLNKSVYVNNHFYFIISLIFSLFIIL